MNIIAKSTFFIGLISFTVINAPASKANEGNQAGNTYTLTTNKLSQKQFTKGYRAERSDYRIQKSSSTRKMKKRLKGTWFQRWLNRNF